LEKRKGRGNSRAERKNGAPTAKGGTQVPQEKEKESVEGPKSRRVTGA